MPARKLLTTILFTTWLPALLALPAVASSSGITAIRINPGEQILLDGTLSSAVWQRAPVFSGFVEKSPKPGQAPQHETRVQVVFDDKAVYIGITALDPLPESIRAPLVRRDAVDDTEDYVAVHVDTMGEKNSAQFFRVNAAGSKADGMYTSNDDEEDLAPDFDFDAATKRHANGYTALFKIPFSSLRYGSGRNDGWRLLVTRSVPRQQFTTYASALIPYDAANLIDATPVLQGMEVPKKSEFLILRPSTTLSQVSNQIGHAAHEGQNRQEASLDIKWRPIPELVLDGTLRPDFSQIDLDVPQIAGNTRFALFYPEKRPFFFEASDLLRSPTNAIYTRSFTEPKWGARATWRGSNLAGTAILLDDRGGGQILLPGPYETGYAEQPASRALVLRGLQNRGSVQAGASLSSRKYDNDRGENNVFGPDFTWTPNQHWIIQGQWLHAKTRMVASDGSGANLSIHKRGNSKYFNVLHHTEDQQYELTVQDISEGFRNDSGFVNQANFRSIAAHYGRGWRDFSSINELWFNFDLTHMRDKSSGKAIKAEMIPGIWISAPGNTRGSLALHGVSLIRTQADSAILREKYLKGKISTTVNQWLPFIESSLSVGRLADVSANQVRRGVLWNINARLRPIQSLSLEPGLSLQSLSGDGHQSYRETAAELKAVWFFNAASDIRIIVQKTSLNRPAQYNRQAEQEQGKNTSLTYTRRYSAGTVLYAGLSHDRSGVETISRGRQAFVKLQVDVDEVRR
jgi:Domain of unknown function (DUF5916)